MKKIVYILLSCFAPLLATAQNENGFFYNPNEENDRQRLESRRDTTNKETPNVPHYRTAWQWIGGGLYKKYVPLDSLTDGIHNYNAIFKQSISNSYLGNFPSPYQSDILLLRETSQDFYPLNSVRAYLFKPEDALQWNVTTPFTRLDYFNGGPKAKSENWLDLWHVQNIKPYWSAGIRYNLISSAGSYSYQQAKTYHFTLFSNYEYERYAASFFINQNMGHFDENGGVANHAEIRDTIINSKYVLTKINSSPNSEPNNNYKNFNLRVQLQYNIGRGPRRAAPAADTLPAASQPLVDTLPPVDSLPPPPSAPRFLLDSLTTDTLQPSPPDTIPYTYPIKAILDVRVENNKHTFKEITVDHAFFPRTYIDSASHNNIYESKLLQLAGQLVLNQNPSHPLRPGLHAGGVYKKTDYYQQVRIDKDSTTNDFATLTYKSLLLTGGIFNNDTTTNLNYRATASLCILGSYAADYTLQAEATRYIGKQRNANLNVKATLQQLSPNPFFQRYTGNHDLWQNSFNKTTTREIQTIINAPRYHNQTGLAARSTSGYIHLDTLATPVQHDSPILTLTAWIKQSIPLGHFTLDQTLYYQTTSNPNANPLPAIALYSHNYYQNTFFKKALAVQAGIDLFYNTAFRAPAYNPATMQFHQQDKQKTGNYPKVDLFVTLRVKRADIFIKYEHASQYIANRNYFSTPDYPINPARVKYGVRWNFFD
ncbi:MAG: putative porin [Odoribacteraceae bacterium]|jgi:hypothetical protein|nr:putative porin [Odoribacteraceae bacterium]